MDWKELFTGHHARDGYAEISPRVSIWHPSKLTTKENVTIEDRRAAQIIQQLTTQIEALQSYRIALQQRYGELATMENHLVIRLERSHIYGCPIHYYLTTRRRYEDGTEALETSKRYEGKYRHQAIQDFNALVSANPAAIAEKSIEKPKWER